MKKGFTLIELMVVILIVAILAAVAIPILRGRLEAAKWSEGKATMGTIATSIRAWAAEKGVGYATGPAGLAGLGFAAGDCTGTYFKDADFSYTVTVPVTSPVQFQVSCASGTQPGGPTTPVGGYTLTGAATGIATWAP